MAGGAQDTMPPRGAPGTVGAEGGGRTWSVYCAFCEKERADEGSAGLAGYFSGLWAMGSSLAVWDLAPE